MKQTCKKNSEIIKKYTNRMCNGLKKQIKAKQGKTFHPSIHSFIILSIFLLFYLYVFSFYFFYIFISIENGNGKINQA